MIKIGDQNGYMSKIIRRIIIKSNTRKKKLRNGRNISFTRMEKFVKAI